MYKLKLRFETLLLYIRKFIEKEGLFHNNSTNKKEEKRGKKKHLTISILYIVYIFEGENSFYFVMFYC